MPLVTVQRDHYCTITAMKARIHISMDEELAAKAAKRAEVEGRSLSNLGERALKVYLSIDAYDDLAAVILEAAERIRAQEKAS